MTPPIGLVFPFYGVSALVPHTPELGWRPPAAMDWTDCLTWPVPLTCPGVLEEGRSAGGPIAAAVRPLASMVAVISPSSQLQTAFARAVVALDVADRYDLAERTPWRSAAMVDGFLHRATESPSLLAAWGRNPRLSPAVETAISRGLLGTLHQPTRRAMRFYLEQNAANEACLLWAAVRRDVTGAYPRTLDEFADPDTVLTTLRTAGTETGHTWRAVALATRLDAHRTPPRFDAAFLARLGAAVPLQRAPHAHPGTLPNVAWALAEAVVHPAATPAVWERAATVCAAWGGALAPGDRTLPHFEPLAILLHALALVPAARATPAVRARLDEVPALPSRLPGLVVLGALDTEGEPFWQALVTLLERAPDSVPWVLQHTDCRGVRSLDPTVLQLLLECGPTDVRLAAVRSLHQMTADPVVVGPIVPRSLTGRRPA